MVIAAADSANAAENKAFIINPHDSLLFDGGSFQSNDQFSSYYQTGCYARVFTVIGNATGTVLKKQIIKACGPDDTIIIANNQKLEIGDILESGSMVMTDINSLVILSIFNKGTLTRAYITVKADSWTITPEFVDCTNILRVTPEIEKERYDHKKVPEVIKVIKGEVTWDSPPGTNFNVSTKGKNSSVIHTKTNYSHEVKIDGIDTIDVIRVYKGSVEVSMENIEVPNEAEMSKNIEQLGADLQAGKITGEELQAKMKDFQFFGQNLSELVQPLNVDEGFKCTVTKSTRVVEPLGAGDEDK